MSGDEQNIPGGLRRVGRKDQKRRLDPTGPLFPDDDADDAQAESAPPPARLPRDPNLPPDLLDDVEHALESLSDADFDADIKAAARPVVETPPAERFPPLRPPDDPRPAPAMPAAEPATGRKRRQGDWRHNVVAVIFAVATLGMCAYYSVLWNNPYSPLNPLAPATPFIIITATPDPLAGFNADSTATAIAIAAALAVPTDTPPPFDPTATSSSGFGLPFQLEESGVIYAPNSNGRGCDWASIAGTVVGLDGAPVNNYGVQIIDQENPDRLSARVFSGSALTFGPGGFELTLGGTPLMGIYTVQLFSPVGAPVSEVYTVITSSECDQNVVIINFVQVREL